jgi:hypothetical protein
MTATAAPFGLRPVRHLSGGEIRTQGFPKGVDDGSTATFYLGQPLKFTSGYLVAASAGDTSIAGVFAGCQYIDTASTRFHAVQFAASYAGVSTTKDVLIHMWTDPNIIFQIQASTAAAITARGQYADFTSSGGNAITGDSAISLGTLGAGVANLLVLDRMEIPDNDWGTGYPIVEVVFAEHLLIR